MRSLAPVRVSWSSEDVDPKREAKRLVDQWRRRAWASGAAPIHVHPLDLTKLEEMIADLLQAQADHLSHASSSVSAKPLS